MADVEKLSTAKTATSIVAVIVSIASLIYAHYANGYAREANTLAEKANHLAEASARKQGTVVVFDRAQVKLYDSGSKSWRNIWASENGDRRQVPSDPWLVGGINRYLQFAARNEGLSDAHIAQIELRLNADGSSSVYGDPIKVECTDGPESESGPCPAVLPAGGSMLVSIMLTDAYVKQVDPAYRPAGIVACMYVGGLSQCYETHITLPNVAFA